MGSARYVSRLANLGEQEADAQQVGAGAAAGINHRPDAEQPPGPNRERRRLWMWAAFLGFSPICLGVVAWAAVAWNGSYPTVAPPVPPGWQAVAGIYASFSVPKRWVLQPGMADAQGDAYYSGPGGAAGEVVRQASSQPQPRREVPPVVSTFLGGRYHVASIRPYRLHNATEAWEYLFRLGGSKQGLGVLAWAKATQSVVWLVATPASPTANKVLSTLTLAT
jgi:hypothetical protein